MFGENNPILVLGAALWGNLLKMATRVPIHKQFLSRHLKYDEAAY